MSHLEKDGEDKEMGENRENKPPIVVISYMAELSENIRCACM